MNVTETLAAIAAPLPREVVSTKSLQGKRISYITWHDACALMDQRAPGWSYEVREVGNVKNLVYVTVRVIVPTDDGAIYRDATGNENDQTSGYGDPFSNAESMAIRRAFVKFGLGRELYKGKIAPDAPDASSNGHEPESGPPAQLSDAATDKQIKAVFGIMRGAMGDEYSVEKARQIMTMRTGAKKAGDMTKRQASDLIEWLKSDTVEAEIGQMLQLTAA